MRSEVESDFCRLLCNPVSVILPSQILHVQYVLLEARRSCPRIAVGSLCLEYERHVELALVEPLMTGQPKLIRSLVHSVNESGRS